MDRSDGILTVVVHSYHEDWHNSVSARCVVVTLGAQRDVKQFDRAILEYALTFDATDPSEKLRFSVYDDEELEDRRAFASIPINSILSGKRKYDRENVHMVSDEGVETPGVMNISVIYAANTGHLSKDDFETISVVGKGGFGKVLQVRKKDTNRIYAMKVMKKDLILKRKKVEHIRSEQMVMTKFRHPFILSLKYSFQTDERLYLVMDYVNGGDLLFHLKREYMFPEYLVRFYAAEVLLALEYVHESGIILRDLKIENVLLDNEGHVVVCDFGLVKRNMYGTASRTNTFCGTAAYLAPEVLLRRQYSNVVDFWSLGILMYELLTGFPPFYDEDTDIMYENIVRAPLHFPPYLSSSCKDILRKLLCRNPKTRLGHLGAIQVKSHPFFENVDFEKLYHRVLRPPWRPSVVNANSVENVNENLKQLSTRETLTEDNSEVPTDTFEGFSYNHEEDSVLKNAVDALTERIQISPSASAVDGELPSSEISETETDRVQRGVVREVMGSLTSSSEVFYSNRGSTLSIDSLSTLDDSVINRRVVCLPHRKHNANVAERGEEDSLAASGIAMAPRLKSFAPVLARMKNVLLANEQHTAAGNSFDNVSGFRTLDEVCGEVKNVSTWYNSMGRDDLLRLRKEFMFDVTSHVLSHPIASQYFHSYLVDSKADDSETLYHWLMDYYDRPLFDTIVDINDMFSNNAGLSMEMQDELASAAAIFRQSEMWPGSPPQSRKGSAGELPSSSSSSSSSSSLQFPPSQVFTEPTYSSVPSPNAPIDDGEMVFGSPIAKMRKSQRRTSTDITNGMNGSSIVGTLRTPVGSTTATSSLESIRDGVVHKMSSSIASITGTSKLDRPDPSVELSRDMFDKLKSMIISHLSRTWMIEFASSTQFSNLHKLSSKMDKLARSTTSANHPLHHAAAKGNVSEVLKLLECGTMVDLRNDAHETPLHVACRHRKAGVIRELLNNGADVHGLDAGGNTPLHIAVGQGSLACVSALLDMGHASVEAVNDDGSTPLHVAAHLDRGGAAQLLIAAGAVVHAQNVLNETPFDLAGRHVKALFRTLLFRSLIEENYLSDLSCDNVIEWSPVFSCGLSVLDDDHYRMFEYLNAIWRILRTWEMKVREVGRFSTSSMQHADFPNVIPFVNGFLDFTVCHFNNEEVLMPSTTLSSDRVVAHLRAHERLTLGTIEMKKRLQRRDSAVTQMVFEFLKEYFINHLITFDKELSANLVSGAEAAPTRTDEPSNSSDANSWYGMGI